MNLLKLVAQFLVVLVIGYAVAVAMACAIGSSCPFQGLRPSKPTSTGAWRSAPSARHYAQSPKKWITAFRRYGRSSRRRTAWTALRSAAFNLRLATAERRASLVTPARRRPALMAPDTSAARTAAGGCPSGLPCALGEGLFEWCRPEYKCSKLISTAQGIFSMAIDVNDIRAAVRRRAAHRDSITTWGLTATLLAAVLLAALKMVPS
jgi:hypothetical protein